MSAQEKSESIGSVGIKDRRELRMDGVRNVVGFDDGYVSLDTELGEVTVEGCDMKIERLMEGGEILVKGRIDALYFTDRKQKRGFFGGIFG